MDALKKLTLLKSISFTIKFVKILIQSSCMTIYLCHDPLPAHKTEKVNKILIAYSFTISYINSVLKPSNLPVTLVEVRPLL